MRFPFHARSRRSLARRSVSCACLPLLLAAVAATASASAGSLPASGHCSGVHCLAAADGAATTNRLCSPRPAAWGDAAALARRAVCHVGFDGAPRFVPSHAVDAVEGAADVLDEEGAADVLDEEDAAGGTPATTRERRYTLQQSPEHTSVFPRMTLMFQEAKNWPNIPSQEKYHRRILRGLRNISDTP